MEWTQLLKDLADTVAVRNDQVNAVRNTSTHVVELTTRAIAAGAPSTPLTRILAKLEPVVAPDRPHTGMSLAVPPPRADILPPPSDPPLTPEDYPAIVRQLLDAFAARDNPRRLTITQIAHHLVGADQATWGQGKGRRDRLAMIGRTIGTELRRAGMKVPHRRLDSAVDPQRPTVYRLAGIERALQMGGWQCPEAEDGRPHPVRFATDEEHRNGKHR
ncbi:hypothetical protein [Streptomyces yunnanensis]|uniref:hypothetical protein n=1 Tax=Streptomyces yunnanensis TaxID=156453 RepID=UPI0011610CE0|nr:hypothetical protein [Streptomyces yunnanensis]